MHLETGLPPGTVCPLSGAASDTCRSPTCQTDAAFAPPAAGLSHLDDSPLAQVCSYIHSHLGEELPIDILCRIACMNSRQLNTLFRKTFHQRTVEYIRSSRLAKARELLCFSQESVTSIAEQTGFKSVHYFSRVFKESEGISPGEYKKRLGRALAPDAASHPTGKNSLV